MVLQLSGCHSCSQSSLSVALGTLPFPQGPGEPCPGAQAVSPGTGWCRVAGTTSGCGACGAEPCARVPSTWASTTPWTSPTWPSRRGPGPSRSRRTARCKGLSLSPGLGSLAGGSSAALPAWQSPSPLPTVLCWGSPSKYSCLLELGEPLPTQHMAPPRRDLAACRTASFLLPCCCSAIFSDSLPT